MLAGRTRGSAGEQTVQNISLNADPSILIRKKINNDITIVSIYVDDFLLGSNEIETINGLKEDLKESAVEVQPPWRSRGGALPR